MVAPLAIVVSSMWLKPLIVTLSATRTRGPKNTFGSITTSRPSLVSKLRVDRFGVEHGDATGHRGCPQTALNDAFRFGQLGARVDTEQFFVRSFNHGATESIGTSDANNIGEVALALRIVGADPIQQLEEMASIDRHHARIDQADASLSRRRVAVFDDRLERPIVRSDETAIGAGIIGPHAEHDDGRRFATAWLAAVPRSSLRIVVPVRNGVSPNTTSTSPLKPLSAARAASTASPVPRGGSWMAVAQGETTAATSSISRPMTTTVRSGF